MITVTNPEAIAAKHDHPSGINCKENNEGQMVLTGWPDSLPYPTQAEVEKWESEYTPPADPDDAIDAAISSANTVAELRDALLGRARGRGRKP